MADSNNVSLERELDRLAAEIVSCSRCPRLREHCRHMATVKRRAYRDETYWGQPVPSFGPANARLLIVGLAPGAHGANRTGRVFTGDMSGELLFRVLYGAGFASQPVSTRLSDGLQLIDARIACAVRCAPPENTPSGEEMKTCRMWLQRELELLSQVRVVVALGRIGFDAYLSVLKGQGAIDSRSAFAFGHACEYRPHAGGPVLIGSYHPSQQNTSTGKLTAEMLGAIFVRARQVIAE